MSPEGGAASSSTLTVSEAVNTGEVRVVRCPKCGLLLPEYAGLALYRCGGCSTPLVAKKQVLSRQSLEKSETEGPGSSCYPGLPSVDEGRSQVVENKNRESSCTDRILVSGDPAASSIMEDEAEMTLETERVTNFQSKRLQTCESPGTPPNKEDNSRCVQDEDSARINLESIHKSIDIGSIHEEEIPALQTESPERSETERLQASDDPGASIKELSPSIDQGHIKGNCRNHLLENMSLVADMAGLSVGTLDYGNQLDEPRGISKKGEAEKHGILTSTHQYEDVDMQYKKLPNDKVLDDGFLGSDQRIKTGIKQRKEKTLRVETVDGLAYIHESFEYYGHSKDIRSREKKTPKVSSKKDRYSHCNEGPSNFHNNSVADAAPNRVEHERQDKEELLRMLDELRDQLSRSRKVKDTPTSRYQMNKWKDSTNPSRRPGHNGWFQEGTSTDWSAVEELPKMRHKLNQNGFHLSLPAYEKRFDREEPLRSHVHKRPPYESSHQNPLLASNAYRNRPFLSGPLPPHPHNACLHQSSCLCTHCLNNIHHRPLPGALPASKNKTNPNSTGGHGFSLVENAEVLDAGYSKSVRRRYPHGRSNPPNFRKSGPIQRCRSLAGAAPFIICDRCLNSLQLPSDILMSKNKWKIQCGSCLCLLVVKINGIHLTVSATTSHLHPIGSDANRMVVGLPNQCEVQHVPTDFRLGDFSGPTLKIASPNKRLLLSSTPFSANNELVEQQSTSDLTQFNRKEEPSLSYGVSPCENPKEMHYDREMPKPLHDKDPFPHKSEDDLEVPGSPLNENFRYLGSNDAMNNNDIGSQGPHPQRAHEGPFTGSAMMVKVDPPTDEFSNSTLSIPGGVSENVLYPKPLSECSEHTQRSPKNPYVSESAHHNFGHEASPQVSYRTNTSDALAMKKHFSDNRYSNRGFPQDSKHEHIDDPSKINKGGRLSFTGLIKKSFKNISHTTESVNSGKRKVVINGYPIPDHLIRKAEQTAGPILPGSYWYDYDAGFWGVSGQPCLGIIPPHIEEFKYPMQKNCSGGNTSILINGRELNQTESNLLAERGLPTSRNKSYIVEISGRIFDVESREELESLGKLAPTVAQLGRGFGMCPLSLI